jgi:hypothetical protein
MKVADLQQHLADLGRLLQPTKAKDVAHDLAAVSEALGPLKDKTLTRLLPLLRVLDDQLV